MNMQSQKYSDYIVYADESGDHSLVSIDEGYPVFVLSFCIFQKKYYAHVVTPAFRMLKFSTFGHDMVILHEHDIRKGKGPFEQMNLEKRGFFINRLNALIAEMHFIPLIIVIDKRELKQRDIHEVHVYHLAMQLGLEQLYDFIHSQNQHERLTHIICEARGLREDKELHQEFARVCAGDQSFQKRLPFELVVADKKTNSTGLQFADLVARPAGLAVVRPSQPNRAFEVLERKLNARIGEKGSGSRLHLYPMKSAKPQSFL